ncbi:glycosyl hydrolase [Paenibacillus sp. YIM B09110]|uniref:glycosyl hydrolase n=1 Tax=Paenibacillus sp. YIM B09110 TaxID=3126102 RepID=UPI00301DD09F
MVEMFEQFNSPANRYRPKMRWWLPGGFMNDDEIKREIEWMLEKGYGGAEIIHFIGIPTEDVDSADYGSYTFGSEEWNNRMKAALKTAIPLDFQLDFTVGPLWPIATPVIMDKNDERCTHGLHVGMASFKGTYAGAVPASDTIDGDRPCKLVAITAARRHNGEEIGKLLTFDTDTAVDLTSHRVDERIEWSAPTEGEWCLFGFWSQTNGQMNDSIAAPVIDHFSSTAAEAVTGFWDDRLMGDSEIRDLYEQNAGCLFCDSIELNATMLGGMYGATPMAVSIWSPGLLDEFRIRRGYDLTPYLPSLFVKGLYQLGAGNRTDGDSEYDFSDQTVNRRIRNDFFQTLTDMFRYNHLRVLRHWANGHRMTLRYQTYGLSTELTAGLLELDIPETESLGFGDSTDGYRLQSGAVHLSDREIYSFEVGAVMGYGYKQTWTGKDYGLLWQLHRGFASGVNQAILHGMSYESQSVAGHFGTMFKWPGISLMGSMFSNEWGGRQPNSLHARDVINYISRNQYVLRIGSPKVDLAIYRHHIDGIHHGMGTDPTLYERSGYTYDFVSSCLLELEQAEVGTFDGRPALASKGPAYRAILVDMRKNTETGDWMPSDMPLTTVNRLITFAESGLPIVIVGETLRHVLSYRGDRKTMAAEESDLRLRIDHLVQMPSVCQVANQHDAVEALARLSVSPAVQVGSGLHLLSARRYQDGVNYYYLYNPNLKETFEGDVQLEGTGNPFRLNAWVGTVHAMVAEQKSPEQSTVKLRLAPNATALIAVANEWSGERTSDKHVFDGYQEKIFLERWSVVVDSWSAGEKPTETKIDRIELELDKLQSWTLIPELKDKSGISRYFARFRLDRTAGEGEEVLLDLGEVSDTFRLSINGHSLRAVDQLDRRIPIGSYIKTNENNTLEVEVATTLNNALRVYEPQREQQECGLIGPVIIYY